MTIQDLGSLGELVAAAATVATLIYLAVQVRQNTRAQRSSTFQQISAQMGRNVETITTNPDLAEIVVKGFSGDKLTPAERIRFQGLLVMSFRRLESVYVQYQLGSLDKEYRDGFEKALLPMIIEPAGAEWWKSGKETFHKSFVAHVDERLESGEIADHMPSMQISDDKSPA